MVSPIGYTPPANPHAAMPVQGNTFHGLSPLPAMGAAMAAQAPLQAQIQQSQEYDTQASKAAKFQRLLQSGQQGMQAYIQDVGKTNPDLAAQFTQEFTTVAPFMQNLKGKELTDMALNMYDSWNGRMGGAKMGSYMSENPEAPMTDILGKTNGSMTTKDMVTAKGTDDLRKSTIAKNAADIEYTKNKPGLQLRLQGMRDDAKLRAVRIRATTDKNGAKQMQYTFNDAKQSFEEVSRQIEALSADIAKDPVMGKFEGNVQLLSQMRREKVGWQKAMQHAVEKGAKPDQLISKPPDLDLGQGAAPGLTAAVDASVAGIQDPAGTPPPTPSFGNVSSKSSPQEIGVYLQAVRPGKTPTPAEIENFRRALATDEGAGAR